MSTVPEEVAATQGGGGPHAPADTSWLILQRLDDLRRGQDALKADLGKRIDDLQSSQTALKADLSKRIDDVQVNLGKRIDDVQAAQAALKADLDKRIDGVQADVAWVRNSALGLLLLAILGILAKLLLPGA